jgi:hypothetical protein
MTVRKTLRILGVSLTLLVLLVFATVVVSDFDCHNSADDARCPYCHLTHQGPAEPEVAHVVSALAPIALLPLPQDSNPGVTPVFSHTAPRAPPA